MEQLSLIEIAGGLLIAGLTALAGWQTALRKTRADESRLALESWKELIDPLKLELKEARLEIASLRAHIDSIERNHKEERQHLLDKIKELKQQLEKFE